MAYVLKIKFENNLRRLTFQEGEIESGLLTFSHLESRIRELFQLPSAAPLAVTYTDEEEDVVTMGNDEDLKDALVEQSLNPLRIRVTLSKTKIDEKADTGKAVEVDDAELVLKRLLRTLSSTPEAVGETVKRAFQAYEPLFEGVKSSGQIPRQVETALHAIAAQVSSALKNGAAAASAAAAAAAAAAPVSSEVASGCSNQTNHQGPPFCSFVGGPSPVFHGAPVSSEVASGAVPACSNQANNQRPPFCSLVGGPSPVLNGACNTDSEHDGSLIVHHGVICDFCGVSPIVGNRWKSKEKFDYDLCHSCYEKHGSEKEYSKIEEPKFRPRHMHGGAHRMGHPFHPMGIAPPFHHPMGLHGHFHGGRPFGGRGPCARGSLGRCLSATSLAGRSNGAYGCEEKLYARFVCDVTVFDGTEMAPGTKFVKIWRLRNSGTVPWPVNTSLVFVGGDELGHVSTVPLEIPEQGLAPEDEMEASVDMAAPGKHGRYVSHWRLASPDGPKFGQRLSVIIQVVPKTTLDEVPAELGGDLVAGSSSQKAELADEGEVVDGVSYLHIEPTGIVEDSVRDDASNDLPKPFFVDDFMVLKEFPSPSQSGDDDLPKTSDQHVPEFPEETPSAAQSSDIGRSVIPLVGNPAIDVANTLVEVTEEENKKASGVTPTVAEELDTGVGENKETVPKASEASPAVEGSITYPVLNGTQNQGPITYPVVETGVTVESAEGEDLSTTKALLVKLEAMGFTDSKLNAELLEKNGYDLRKTLDDLCAAEEWDPILEELEEMGFYDTVMNRRLMFKNNGSVKRVVKELVQMYRDIQGKREKVE